MKKTLSYSDHLDLIIDYDEVDESFDHEFGTKKETGFEINSVAYIIYIDGIDFDVTASMQETNSHEGFMFWANEKLVDRVYINRLIC